MYIPPHRSPDNLQTVSQAADHDPKHPSGTQDSPAQRDFDRKPIVAGGKVRTSESDLSDAFDSWTDNCQVGEDMRGIVGKRPMYREVTALWLNRRQAT